MLSAYANCMKIPELRQRIIFTLGIVALCRLAGNIPVPGIDPHELEGLFKAMENSSGGGVLNMFNMFSGGALQKFAVAALGIMPYISASIVIQLMTPVIPQLGKLMREGDVGRQKISQYTRYLTVLICIVQGSMLAKTMANPEMLGLPGGHHPVIHPGIAFNLSTTLIVMTGTVFLMWLGEQITARGVGNGASIIITIGIIDRLPSALGGMFSLVRAGGSSSMQSFTIIHLLILLAMFFFICAATVALTQGHRKVPVKYARNSMGKGVVAGQTSYMPLRVNYSGVMPLIFASAVLMFPPMVLNMIPATRSWVAFFTYGGIWYMASYGVLILLFSFFWVANQFNPIQIADDLQKHGAFVPGVRPGQPTADYLDHAMTRITFAGAIFLTALAILPMILSRQFNLPSMIASFFGGTTLLITVGVMLDTMRQVEAFLLSYHYDGFLSKGHLRSRRNG